jgi:hypothetical protein
MLTVSFTPDYQAAGTYPLQAVANSPTDGRMASAPFTVTIANGADPVFPLNPNDISTVTIPPTNLVGDFDGDGKADLASCAVDNNAVYTIYVLYGDTSGLPLGLPPLGSANYLSYTFNGTAPTPTTSLNTRLRCTGADMDGDGKSDIIISDPGVSTTGMIYIVWGVARGAPSPLLGIPAMAQANIAAGETLGKGTVFVGHYSAGGVADFATQTFPTAGGDNIYVFTGKTMRPMAALAFETPEKHTSTDLCAARTIMGFGDVDGMGLEQLLVWDRNVGGDCTNKGGISLFKSGVMTDAGYVRPSGSTTAWANPSALCDVDGDGKADLVFPDSAANGKAFVFFSPLPTTPLPSPLPQIDGTAAATIAASPTGHLYNDVHCAKGFFGAGATTMITDPGDATNPVRVDLTTNNSKTPSISRQLPDPVPTDQVYGKFIGGQGDVNGDGKQDVLVGTPGGRYWIIYGR